MVWSIDALRQQRQGEAQEAVRPHLQQHAARITEPAVGASTCASGSQVWNGNIGTLIAKPMKKAQKTHCCMPSGRLSLISSEISKV